MSSNNGHTASPLKIPVEYTSSPEEFLSIHELKQLVHQLDQSDILELEVRSLENKVRLILRKAQPAEQNAVQGAEPSLVPESAVEDTQYTITAPRVGIFHPWSSAKEQTPIALGERIEQGQHVGIIQALNVLNEIEAPVTGQIVALLAENGQPVEYGQPLIIIAKQ